MFQIDYPSICYTSLVDLASQQPVKTTVHERVCVWTKTLHMLVLRRSVVLYIFLHFLIFFLYVGIYSYNSHLPMIIIIIIK